jgi:hypothetical protein
MPHILASLKGMNAEDIRKKLKIDAPHNTRNEDYIWNTFGKISMIYLGTLSVKKMNKFLSILT